MLFSQNYLSISQKKSNFAPAFGVFVILGIHVTSGNTFFYITTLLNLKQNKMIIVPVKEGENIERALKKFKRKFEKTGVVKELRSRQQFNKPSVLKRLKMEHAIYVQQLRQNEE